MCNSASLGQSKWTRRSKQNWPTQRTRVLAAVGVFILFGAVWILVGRSQTLSQYDEPEGYTHEWILPRKKNASIEGETTADGTSEKLYLHYVRFKPQDAKVLTLRFLDYLSVVSAVQRLKPDDIFIHGDVEPTGTYWEELKTQGWVKYLYREKNFTLNGRQSTLEHIFHVSDKTKLDILVEYGGIAIDWDVYFVRGERIRPVFHNHRAVTCYEDEFGYNLGLAGGWKNSRLLHAWRRSYQASAAPIN
ncbi:hypothetical protein BV898_18791 [Hypsibius exemplaris]|uniref:Uncharacterized protein n=1 Tax=Hypsibius exemplaris TaxID=2072580 RepID=A0A9X6NHY1_HYPEX|nr:hypothetical protein BV898_18791 [Hypsibius exemplaris]